MTAHSTYHVMVLSQLLFNQLNRQGGYAILQSTHLGDTTHLFVLHGKRPVL
jgi:hypothetical protein